MIQINTKNLHAIVQKHGLKKSELFRSKKDMISLINQIHTRGQQFYGIVDEIDQAQAIQKWAKTQHGKFDHIVLIGIGGSALGAITLNQALSHLYKTELKTKTTPILHVLDNVDPVTIHELENIIDLKKTLFLIVSKSGNTAEALGPYIYFAHQLKKQKLSLKDHVIAITHNDSGILSELVKKEGLQNFEHGPVGGRFSVLSTVGLVPAALIGIDIVQLLQGAQHMRDQFLNPNAKENISYQIASIQHQLYAKGKCITVLMPYAQKLTSFADWYRQLLAESIGKEKNDEGKTVHIGITPVKALGTTDQHSQSQLYNEGPNDKFLIFIEVKKLSKALKIPTLYKNHTQLSYLQGATMNDLIDSERTATADALTKRNRPNITVSIDQIDEQHLGGLFMLFEGATAFLGELFHINAFNQPGVELAKKLTIRYLAKKRKKH